MNNLDDIKRLAGLQEANTVSEVVAAVRTISDAINVLATLRRQAKEIQLQHVDTKGLAGDVIEELYSVILFLEKHRDTMHRG